MPKFLIEAECANLTDHHLFWCSKCKTNKVDSLEHSSGRFFCVLGQEFYGTVGDPKQVIFALCTGCLATDMWGLPEEEVKSPIISYLVPPRSTWKQVQNSPAFKTAFKKRELSVCINLVAREMRSSLEDAKELVVTLLDEVNHNDRSEFVSSLNSSN